MKKFEKFTKRDLKKLRGEIVLNSCFTSDYENSFGISADSVAAFFDGYYDYLWELAMEDYGNDINHGKVIEKYDTIDNLVGWFNCHDDFSWVKYNNVA